MEQRIEEFKSLLKSRLNEKRYIHSLCVADEAERLAVKYGADPKKAYFAGLLHDITKNSDEKEHLEIIEKYNLELNEIEKSSQKLWHAITGAAYIRYVLKIDDNDIYNAVLHHTTAKSKMTALETVLYLADFTSLDRDYEDVEEMRRLVDISTEDALSYALSYTIKELIGKKVAIHPDTLNAYNEVMLKEKK